jgi:peptide/nickel transport system substrate-binding protein
MHGVRFPESESTKLINMVPFYSKKVINMCARTFKAMLMALLATLMIISSLSPTIQQAQGYIPPGISRQDLLIAEAFEGKAVAPEQFNIWLLTYSGVPWSSGIHQLMLTALWYVNASDGSIMNGLAAELPKWNENFSELTIKLKHGIYWSDGVEHTAEDWVYTINKALTDERHGFYADATVWIDSISAPDNYTVVIKLKQPNVHFWLWFTVGVWSAYLYPMPAHIFEKVEASGTPWYEYNFYPPVSLGPYVLKDHDPTGYWYLYQLRDDWDRTVVGRWLKEQGRSWTGPKYVLFVAYDTEEQKIAAAGKHELDYLFDVTAEAFDAIRSLNPDARSVVSHVPYQNSLSVCSRGVYFNLEKYPYNLTQVRWAIALSINVTDFVISTMRGICKFNPIHATYGPSMKAMYDKVMPWLESFELTLPNGTKFKPYDPEYPLRVASWAVSNGYLSSMPSPEEAKLYWGPGWYKYAPDVAEQLLKSVGFYRGSDDKWRLPNGELWHIVFHSAGSWEIDGMRMSYGLVEQWKKFGIDAEVRVEDTSTFYDLGYSGLYEIGGWWCLGNQGVGIVDWVQRVLELHSKYYQPSGQYSPNRIRLRDPKLDEVLDAMASTPTLLPNGTVNPDFLDLTLDYNKIMIENMYYVVTHVTKKLAVFDLKYWEGYPIEEEGWPSSWEAYYFAGAQWLIPLLRPKVSPTPTPTPTPAPIPNWVWGTIGVLVVALVISLAYVTKLRRKSRT